MFTFTGSMGGSPVPPFPSFLSIPSPVALWKRGIQGRQEAGPAPPKTGCFQLPERQAWTCLLVRQASLPLLSPQLSLKQALSSALSTQGRKECFRPKHWFLLQWSPGARDGALGTRLLRLVLGWPGALALTDSGHNQLLCAFSHTDAEHLCWEQEIHANQTENQLY